jgi:hypothetical protein
MKKCAHYSLLLLGLLFGESLLSQTQWTSNGSGQTWLAQPPGWAVQPFTVNVSNTPVSFSALTVLGGTGNLPNQNLFEIHSSSAGAGYARWFRNNSTSQAANEQMGRIYHNGQATNLGFNVQHTQQGGSLWLRNWRNRGNTVNGALNGVGVVDGNGLRLIDDVPFALNGYSGNERRGYVAIGHTGSMDLQGANSASLPWSRLHLVHANNLTSTDPNANYVTPVAWNRTLGYRPWMRNGTMITGNRDQMYIGHKYRYTAGTVPQGNEIVDASDAVIQWADSLVSPAARDNMRFIFTSSPDNTTNPSTGARSVEGLELMRLHPADSSGSIVPYVGLGDFYRLGVVGAADPLPTERLDIANGRMRHRQLPNDLEMTGANKAMVVDGNGLVGWRTWPGGGGGGSDCKWTLLGNSNIATAYTGNPGCPQRNNRVGIGTGDPVRAKLEVVDNPDGNQTFPYGQIGVQVDVRGRATTYQAGVVLILLASCRL